MARGNAVAKLEKYGVPLFGIACGRDRLLHPLLRLQECILEAVNLEALNQFLTSLLRLSRFRPLR
jgi:hypothetical protein